MVSAINKRRLWKHHWYSTRVQYALRLFVCPPVCREPCCSCYNANLASFSLLNKSSIWRHVRNVVSADVWNRVVCILELLFIRCHFYTLELFTFSEIDSIISFMTDCCALYNTQVVIHHHRNEMNDLHVKMNHEHQKTEHLRTINEQVDGKLRDTLKELKVRSSELSTALDSRDKSNFTVIWWPLIYLRFYLTLMSYVT